MSVLEHLSVEGFKLVQLTTPFKDAPWNDGLPSGTWTLQRDGRIWFHIEEALAANRPIALKVFEHVLEAHNNAVHIGYDRGVKSAREVMRRALGIPE